MAKLREHAVLHTPSHHKPAPMIQTQTILSKRVLVLESKVFDVSCVKQTYLCVCGLVQWNTQTMTTTTANGKYLDKATQWHRSCWKRAVWGQAECYLLPKVRGHPAAVWRLRSKLEHPTVRRGSLDPIALRGFLWAGTGGCHTASKVATFRDDVEVEEVFTSRTVRTRGTVFPFVRQCWHERARPDEVEGPSLALRRPDVETEEAEGNLAPGEEMQDDGGREQPDPEELRRPAAEVSADAARARPTMMGGAEPPARNNGAESQ